MTRETTKTVTCDECGDDIPEKERYLSTTTKIEYWRGVDGLEELGYIDLCHDCAGELDGPGWENAVVRFSEGGVGHCHGIKKTVGVGTVGTTELSADEEKSGIAVEIRRRARDRIKEEFYADE